MKPKHAAILRKTIANGGEWCPCGIRGFARSARFLAYNGFVSIIGCGPGYEDVRGVKITAKGIEAINTHTP